MEFWIDYLSTAKAADEGNVSQNTVVLAEISLFVACRNCSRFHRFLTVRIVCFKLTSEAGLEAAILIKALTLRLE